MNSIEITKYLFDKNIKYDFSIKKSLKRYIADILQ